MAVAAFLAGRLAFLGIPEVVADVLARVDGAPARDIDDVSPPTRLRAARRGRNAGGMTYLVVVLGLLLLIFLHELGHFAAARAVGIGRASSTSAFRRRS